MQRAKEGGERRLQGWGGAFLGGERVDMEAEQTQEGVVGTSLSSTSQVLTPIPGSSSFTWAGQIFASKFIIADPSRLMGKTGAQHRKISLNLSCHEATS